ncbi:hypothetical protein C8A00DRAFT_19120 [Chaetomidium leptoderma]|uniref:Uncharacterized protein n=1 Tax=Chaetomidium leptoderma TaxID=669021 RepID=A0AAN6VE17_9PEZI|nr:hypothetical protein C8A00DRAFT_19120 [Chaetomidium leptoderma]
MDGSYGNVFPTSRTMPPSTSAPAPSGNQYKVNVTRQKTRKWANFKPQNYDGDEWGDDYDDEPADEQEPPPPPPKPMGPRHPATYSPTTGPFQPVGSPPLRTHSPQYPGPTSASPSSIPGGLPRSATEPLGSPPHNVQGHPHPQFPPDARRASPALQQSAHALPSQLPPRMSNMGPGDMETRSASPQSAGALVSPTKRLPFVRPADVYQRIEEERQKKRRSLEIGQPGADNSTVRPGAPAVLGTKPQGGAQTDLPTAEDTSIERAINPDSGLTPVAERKSEYGLEGLLASYGIEAPGAEPSTAQGQVNSAEHQKFVHASVDGLRRFSTSPQLPNLSRMSGFGEDLFSSSSFIPASGLRSPVSGSMQIPTSGQHLPDIGESTATAAEAPGQPATVFTPQGLKASQQVSGVGAGADAVPSPPNEPDQDRPVGLSLHQAPAQPVLSDPKQQTPAADAGREPASCTEEQPPALASRPHIPGGWVSETPSMPGELAKPPSPSPSTHQGVPHTETQFEVATFNASNSRQAEPEGTGVLSDADLAKSPVSAQLSSPQALLALRTPSPALSTRSDMSAQQATSAASGRNTPPAPGIQGQDFNNPIPVRATTEHSGITPWAPLNHRRGTPDVNTNAPPVLSLPSPEAEPPLDASNHSPVKDSDLLSEEIMKSLSPALPESGPTDAAGGSTAAYRAAAADPTRESSYLGDVYGDYWATTEDKAEPGLFAMGKTIATENAALEPPPLPTENPQETSTEPAGEFGSSNPSTPSGAAPTKVPNVESENGGHQRQYSWEAAAGGRQRHYSWEAAQEESAPATAPTPATEDLVEQNVLGSGAENVAALPAKSGVLGTEPSQASLSSEGEKSAEDLRAESAPEFNPAAALAPTPALDRPMQPPSPPSDQTDGPSGLKRMSLAEEKIVFEESSRTVAPSPPLEQHPVFAGGSQPPRGGAELPGGGAPSPRGILGFRNIMEMPLPAERIKHYNESRWQLSAVDTGLDEWLKAMTSQHPEHANAVLEASQAQPPTTHGGAGTQAGQGTGGGPGIGRVPLHIPHLQHGLSGLGHSSNQVGAKGKELFMAAGKAGKGLFSKGRNKLRGTGDKVFSS